MPLIIDPQKRQWWLRHSFKDQVTVLTVPLPELSKDMLAQLMVYLDLPAPGPAPRVYYNTFRCWADDKGVEELLPQVADFLRLQDSLLNPMAVLAVAICEQCAPLMAKLARHQQSAADEE